MVQAPVLVTGGAGYIGSHAVLALLDAGRRVVVLDNFSTGSRAAVPEGVILETADVGDAAALDRILAAHAIRDVMHFAGFVRVEESVRDPLSYYANNTGASRTLIARCLAHGVERFVFSSTAAVYGIPDASRVDEDTPTAPINPYGWSKLMTEQMLADAVAAQPGMGVAVLRYFNVAGADPDGRAGQRTKNATHLLKVACEVVTGKRQDMAIFGSDYDTPDGTCVRDFIHVSDLADAHTAVLNWLEPSHGLTRFNCGYGHGYSVREVLAGVERVARKPINPRETDRRPGDPPALIAEADRLRRTVGWTPRLDDLDTIIATALDWERSLGTRDCA